MPGGNGKWDAFNRGLGRHHVAAAVAAMVVSIGVHALLIARVESLPIRSAAGGPERPRFVPIEMVEVRREPPPREEAVPREPLDAPSVEVPFAEDPEEVWTEMATPEPPRLPLPDPVMPEAPPTAPDTEPPPLVRQEVLAIPEALLAEDVIALPRRWDNADIPRMEQAPDIQLPVDLSGDALTAGAFDPAAVAAWISDTEIGTPDWSAVIGSRGRNNGLAPTTTALRPVTQSDATLDERPEDVSRLTGIEDLLQVRIQGYRDTDGYTYFALQVEPAPDAALTVQPRDILLIQDSSASMTPVKIDACRRGLKRWLDFMNPGDRLEIIRFSDDIQPAFGAWRTYDAATRQDAFAFIDRIRALGNTDLFRSLQSALAVERDPARALMMVLISDGRPTVGVTGSSEIIESITRANQGGMSIFAVGGGPKVNSFFLDLLSYRNRGEAVVVRDTEGIVTAAEAWAKQLRRPVLTDLSYRFSRIDPAEIYPKQLTHLFLDRPLMIHGRIPQTDDAIVFQVVGRAGEAWHDFVFALDQSAVTGGPAELRRQWAWQKVYHMIGDYIGDATPERLEAIRAFSDQYGLIVPYGFSRALPRSM